MSLASFRSPSSSFRRLAFLLVFAAGPAVRSQEGLKPPGDQPEPPPPKQEAKELLVSPADEPRPALRYRLLPLSSELTPGNAAPIYMRARHEFSDGFREIDQKSVAWLDLPLDKFPTEEARAFVDQMSGRLKLLEFGARRESCDWNYTVPEQRDDIVSMLLPDAQDMRTWARLLNAKARLETKERNYDGAIRTMETTFAFGRHVGHSPFLIGNLVGMAIENTALARVEEFIAQPDVPNLYWALTTLPRPLIDIREAMEVELRIGENMVPELTEVDRPHTPAGWTALLESMYDHMRSLATKVVVGNDIPASLKSMRARTLDDVRKDFRLKARVYAVSRLKLTDAQVRALPEDQTLAVYLAGHYRDLRDDVFKAYYIPYGENQALADAADAMLKEAKEGPFAVFAEVFPAIRQVQRATARVDRQVAALRVVEALRLYAARHEGRLPGALADIREVPVPADPTTGTSFDYQQADDGATLYAAPLIENVPQLGVNYRIKIRR